MCTSSATTTCWPTPTGPSSATPRSSQGRSTAAPIRLRFCDQVAICCSGFSDGGDSGSLIVSADGNKNPIALLFAGDQTLTYGNRIDLVLAKFGVTMDGGSPPPPVTDLAVSAVSAP